MRPDYSEDQIFPPKEFPLRRSGPHPPLISRLLILTRCGDGRVGRVDLLTSGQSSKGSQSSVPIKRRLSRGTDVTDGKRLKTLETRLFMHLIALLHWRYRTGATWYFFDKGLIFHGVC